MKCRVLIFVFLLIETIVLAQKERSKVEVRSYSPDKAHELIGGDRVANMKSGIRNSDDVLKVDDHSALKIDLEQAFKNPPHYPLQAPQEEIDKYRGTYRQGWLDIRKRRLEKMKTLGLVGNDWVPAASEEANLRDWNALSDEDQDYQDLLMATYSGMIDRIDQNIGKLVEKPKELGEYENTLILFFSDNGACEATMLRERELFERSIPTTQGNSFTTVGADWAFVSKGMSRWELYNMATDPTEQNNLAVRFPEKVKELKAMWWKVATEDERLPALINKPSVNRPSDPKRFVLQQGNQRIKILDRFD